MASRMLPDRSHITICGNTSCPSATNTPHILLGQRSVLTLGYQEMRLQMTEQIRVGRTVRFTSSNM